MDPSAKGEVESILNSNEGVNKKLEKVLAVLTLANLCYGITLKPSALLCHPQNRGGQMVNPFDCHKKGSSVLSAGLKKEILPASSVAMEMSKDAAKRATQVKANEAMMQEADGMLGGITGQERFLTLGNSHMVMFCRSMEQGAKNPSGEVLATPPEVQELLQHGWQWQVVSSSVEDAIPTFPAFCQAALNATNSASICTAELEAMLQLSNYVQKGLAIHQAVEAVKAAQPACSGYLDDIAHFCQYYSGGANFPLLTQLKEFCILAAIDA